MQAMHLPDYPNLLLVGVFFLCGFEFCIGVFLLTGCFRRSAPICAALFMAVMLPLTLWIAVSDPVADCGCFGDALIISNWATFWKNVVLSLAVVWLWRFNASLEWLIRPHLQWIALLITGIYIVAIGMCGYLYQPLLDFRPYPIGSQLTYIEEADGDREGEDQYNLVYEKDGKEYEFSIDDELPSEDDGWTFVRRELTSGSSTDSGASGGSKNVVIDPSLERGEESSGESTFRIWSEDGEEDMTDDAVLHDGEQIILFMPDLAGVSVATTWQINSLYTWAGKHGIDMIGVVSGNEEEIAEWQDLSLAAYPLYTAEDTEIKMVARGNPSVVYLKDGRIVWKSTLRAIPTEDFLSADASGDPASYARNDKAILYNITVIYVMILVVLSFLSYLPELGRFYTWGKRKKVTPEIDGRNEDDDSREDEVSHDDRGVRAE